MAILRTALTPDEVKKTGVAAIRTEYNKLALDYVRITEGKYFYCHCCNEFHSKDSFYTDSRYASGHYPECKKALLKQACDYDKASDKYIDNKAKAIDVFRKLDIPFIESIYNQGLVSIQEDLRERAVPTAYQQTLIIVKSMPQYKGWTFENSEIEDTDVYENQSNKKARKEIKKLFGSGFTESDYLYLQDQFDDLRARTSIDTKSQEIYAVQICSSLLDIYKDRKQGKDVSNKLKSLDQLMNSANLQPKQNVDSASTDSLTLGQLIEKWENEKPIPEPSEEFKDVDGIGKYIRVWFSGWLAKALGLKNGYSQECEEYIKQYTVEKPTYAEEGHSDEIYERLFGSGGE